MIRRSISSRARKKFLRELKYRRQIPELVRADLRYRRLVIRRRQAKSNRKSSDNLIDCAFCARVLLVVVKARGEIIGFFLFFFFFFMSATGRITNKAETVVVPVGSRGGMAAVKSHRASFLRWGNEKNLFNFIIESSMIKLRNLGGEIPCVRKYNKNFQSLITLNFYDSRKKDPKSDLTCSTRFP